MQVRILSIDGGGARGIVPAVILEYIENRLKELSKNPSVRLADFLDFVAGTAVGTMVSCLFVSPNEKVGDKTKEMSQVIEDLFEFSEVYFRKKDKTTLWGLRGPKYTVNKIDLQLIRKFDHWKLKDIKVPVAFIGYDILNREPVIFTNKNGTDKYLDYFIKDIVRGSGATPGFLPPPEFRDGIHQKIVINGNVVSNNPAMIAYIEAGKTGQIINKFNRLSPDNVLLISIGCGHRKLKKYTSEEVKHWNKSKWFTPLIDMRIQSSEIITDYQLKNLYQSYNASDNYIRIDPPLLLSSQSIYDTSEKNMKNLHQDAINYVNSNKELLNQIALQLFNQDEYYSTMLF